MFGVSFIQYLTNNIWWGFVLWRCSSKAFFGGRWWRTRSPIPPRQPTTNQVEVSRISIQPLIGLVFNIWHTLEWLTYLYSHTTLSLYDWRVSYRTFERCRTENLQQSSTPLYEGFILANLNLKCMRCKLLRFSWDIFWNFSNTCIWESQNLRKSKYNT